MSYYSRMLNVLFVVTLTASFSTVYAQQVPPQKFPEGFNLQRGVNISHWLSQSGGRNGVAQKEYFTEKDVTFLADKGFDHIRIPLDEAEMWDYKNDKYNDAFKLLHQSMEWCKQHKLRVIVDLHSLRSHHLFRDDDAQDRFMQCWQELSKELKKYPANLVAYELLNEPAADSAAQWNDLLANTITMIRKQEPKRVIVIGSNEGESYSTFTQLKVPEGDTHIILSFHYYNPFYFTHYRASGTRHQDYNGPIHYPGPSITSKELNQQPATIRNLLAGSTQDYDKDVIADQISIAVKVAKKYKLPLLCGEWGCLNTVPRRDRLRWYRDVKKALDKENIAWTIWDYKGDYGILDANGEADDKLLKGLLKE